MTTQADIIVSGDYDSDWRLVVEIKRRDVDSEVEDQLRRYLQSYNAPLGLLVTPQDLRVFRETYATRGADSVKRIAVHPLPVELRDAARYGVRFERAVQEWIEGLAASGTSAVTDRELAATLDEHIVPVLRDGSIRAGGPRWARAASAK